MIGRFTLEELQKARSSVFDTAADIIYIFDVDTLQILDMNDYGLKELDYTINEIRRFDFYDLHAAEEHDRVSEIIKQYVKNGEIHEIRDLHLLRKDGSLVPVEKNGRITKVDGKSIGH